jgi:glycerol-3-phosphate dehydrogenase
MLVRLLRTYPFLGREHARRLVRAYGTRAHTLLGKAKSFADLGRDFGATLTEAEVRYLMQQEWARSAEDVLWRRTKLGLRLPAEGVEALEASMRDTARDKRAVPSRS